MEHKTDSEQAEQLVENALNPGEHTLSREQAIMYLNQDYPDVFPIRDDEDEEWITRWETDVLDGRRFVSRMWTIKDGRSPCPECDNRRHRFSWWNNGVVNGFQEECTVCGHVFEQEAG